MIPISAVGGGRGVGGGARGRWGGESYLWPAQDAFSDLRTLLSEVFSCAQDGCW